MTKKISLKGCFPPISTPFDSRGRVDHEQLALNLEKWQKTPLAGLWFWVPMARLSLSRKKKNLKPGELLAPPFTRPALYCGHGM